MGAHADVRSEGADGGEMQREGSRGSSTIQEGWAGRFGAKGGYGVGRDAWGRGRLQHRAPLRAAEESFAGRG